MEKRCVDVFIGTYTNARTSEGIYHALLDLETGALLETSLASPATDPTFLELHPNGKFLYAVTERDPGSVGSFYINPSTKQLDLINTASSEGKGPCHICVSSDGKVLLAANYGSGSVASIPISRDGSLGKAASSFQHTGSSVNPGRQKGPHAHSANLSPDNRFAYVADLGIDKLMVYRLDTSSGKLEPNEPPEVRIKAGAGPRHFTFRPDAKFAYLINELDNTIIVFAFDPATGGLAELQTVSTLPQDFNGNKTCAEIKVSPDGKFLYGSNRGHDSIAAYKVDAEKGTLSLLGFQCSGIRNPRNFNIDPTGRFCVVANQDSDTVIVFRINQNTGLLEPTEHSIKVGKPVCVRFLK